MKQTRMRARILSVKRRIVLFARGGKIVQYCTWRGMAKAVKLFERSCESAAARRSARIRFEV
eukprot:COSAG02_NODE_844_length_16583_cov_116.650267_5_plen_62_part_00